MINPLENYAGYAVRRAASAIIAELTRRLEPLDLRVSEASILMVINANLHITQSQIGIALDIQRANMVPLVQRLQQRGPRDAHAGQRSHAGTNAE